MNLKKKIETVPLSKKRLLNAVRNCARRENLRLYLVGGAVRDFVLNRKKYNFDFVIDADVRRLRRLAERVSGQLKGKAVIFPEFFTAKVKSDFWSLDFSCPRREYYVRPGSLPRVKRCGLREDALRRDFTANCLYLSLNRKDFGEVFVFVPRSLEDAVSRVLRVLHKKSFIDDPTRILRGIRFEKELGFKFHSHTMRLLKSALRSKALSFIDETRIRNELDIMFGKEKVSAFIRRINALCGLSFFSSDIRLSGQDLRLLEQIDGLKERTPSVFKGVNFSHAYYAFILGKVDRKKVMDISGRFGFTSALRDVCLDYVDSREKIKNLKLWKDSVKLYIFFKGLKRPTALLHYVRATPGKKRKIRQTLEKIDKIRVYITGKDLKRMGIAQGPVYSRILNSIIEEKVRGNIRTKEDEIRFVKKFKR